MGLTLALALAHLLCVFLVAFPHAEVLKKGSRVHPDLLRREAMAVREKQRTTVYCDQLLQHIASLAL